MESSKYPKPHLPTSQQILEDLIDTDVVNNTEPKEPKDDEIFINAYTCYKNFKQLEQDLLKQDELSKNLIVLHEKLNESINNMKKLSLSVEPTLPT